MLMINEFADLVKLNMADLSTTFAKLLAESSKDYTSIDYHRRVTCGCRLLDTVIEACHLQSSEPLLHLFRIQPNSVRSNCWDDDTVPRSPLVELECLGQVLFPAVTDLQAGKFLWQLLADVRGSLLREGAECTESKLESYGLHPHRRAAALETVAEISTKIASTLDTRQILQVVADLTKERFDLYHAHIYLLSNDGSSLNLAAGAGDIGQQMVTKGWSIPFDREHSLIAQAARKQHGMIANDVKTNPDFKMNSLLPATCSEMAIPMIAGDELLGVLDVQASVTDRFTHEDVRIKTTLAAQVAVALQNARLYEQAQSALSDLQQSQSLLRTVVDSTPDWIFVKDRDYRYRLVNRGYAALFQLTPEEFIGKNDEELRLPEDVITGDAATDILNIRTEKMEMIETDEPKAKSAIVDGNHLFLSTIKVPLYDAEGQVRGLLVMIRDVTKREKLLAEAERRAQREQIIREITAKMQEATSLEGLVKTAAQELGQRLSAGHAIVELGIETVSNPSTNLQ